MKHWPRKFLLIPLIPSLIFSFVICYCLPENEDVEAAISHQQFSESVSASSHDAHSDSHDPQDHHSSPNHQCECPKLQGALAKNFEIIKATDAALYFLNHQIITGKTFLAFISNSRNLLIGPSPPQFPSSAVPLYIKNPTLRI